MAQTQLDRIDYRILEILQTNARISNADLAQAVGLSPSPCLRRVRSLENDGVISQYAALVKADSIGLPVNVFATVTLDRQVEQNLEQFEESVAKRPEVMECYLMTGEYDYLLRIVVPDLASYERFLMDHLTRIDGVAGIKSSFAIRQVQYNTALPMNHLPASSSPHS